LNAHIYNRGKFVYLGIPKNGLISFTDFFKRNGWQYVHPNTNEFRGIFSPHNIEKNNLIMFGSIRDPHSRHIKGLAEQYTRIAKHNDNAFDLKYKDKLEQVFRRNNPMVEFFLSSMLDEHTLPVTKMIPSCVNPYLVNWIPIDHPDHPSEKLMNLFFKENGLNLEMPLDQKRAHVSGGHQKFLQHLISARLEEKRRYYDRFYTKSLLTEDIRLYDHTMKLYREKMKNIPEL